jgi:hypothetical protein
LDALERAQQQLRSGARPDTPEERARAEALAKEQEQIRQQLLDLARRNQERRNAQPLESLDRAGEQASKASQQLSEGDLDEAQQRERDVQRELERAQEELGQEEEQYLELRQEELLFRIGEEVKALIQGHGEAQAAVREIDGAASRRRQSEPRERLRLRRVSEDEAALGRRSGELATAIEAEQSLVFAHVLREVERDLARIARDLGETGNWQTGERVQACRRTWPSRWAGCSMPQLRAAPARGGSAAPPARGQSGPAAAATGPVAEPPGARRGRAAAPAPHGGRDARPPRPLMLINPELAEAGAEVDPTVLDDVLRLAERHERTSKLFESFRTRLGLPAPTDEEQHP